MDLKIRTLNESIARSIYCHQSGQEIFSPYNKQLENKLPKPIIKIAKSRLIKYEDGNN